MSPSKIACEHGSFVRFRQMASQDEIQHPTLEDLIGPVPDGLKSSQGTIKVRGLDVKWWRYDPPVTGEAPRPPVIALHG